MVAKVNFPFAASAVPSGLLCIHNFSAVSKLAIEAFSFAFGLPFSPNFIWFLSAILTLTADAPPGNPFWRLISFIETSNKFGSAGEALIRGFLCTRATSAFPGGAESVKSLASGGALGEPPAEMRLEGIAILSGWSQQADCRAKVAVPHRFFRTHVCRHEGSSSFRVERDKSPGHGGTPEICAPRWRRATPADAWTCFRPDFHFRKRRVAKARRLATLSGFGNQVASGGSP